MISIATPTMWAVFIVFVIIALAVDLLVLKADSSRSATEQ